MSLPPGSHMMSHFLGPRASRDERVAILGLP